VISKANVSKFRFNETLPLKIDISAADGLPGMEGADTGGDGRRYGIPCGAVAAGTGAIADPGMAGTNAEFLSNVESPKKPQRFDEQHRKKRQRQAIPYFCRLIPCSIQKTILS
jgi:hypothetical protein